MGVFSTAKLLCSICGKEFDWTPRSGGDVAVCSRKCYQEFDWRRVLAILGKDYYPDPRPFKEKET